MHRLITILLLAVMILATAIPARSYTFQHTDASASTRLKWPTNTRTIQIALSPSLASPPANIKAGSDVYTAARRALAHWSEIANIQFVEIQSSEQSISASGSPDGVSLITVANTSQNAAAFSPGADIPGRTRVFFDPTNGTITEADVVINPNFANDRFSTDGTAGTYDLESILTHEIGHLLGLDHSGVIGATMQPLLGVNNLYGVQAFTVRTLSEDDIAAVRTLYNPRSNTGAISGTVTYANGTPAFGAHVWAEDISTGKVIAGNVALANGTYRIDDLPAGDYRVMVEYLDGPVGASEFLSRAYAGLRTTPQQPFQSAEAASSINVAAGGTTNRAITLPSAARSLNARLIGLGGTLSTSAVPLSPGGTYTIYVGGEGIDQIPGSGVSVQSSSITVNQASFQSVPGYGLPVISFDVSVSSNVSPGDYTIRLQSNSGEVAYLAGGLTVEAAVQFESANYSVAENANRATLVVIRNGDTTAAASFNYSTVDSAEFIGCDVVRGEALSRCDYVTTVDTLTFAAGETQKMILIPIIDDGYVEGSETLRINLGTQSTVLTIIDNDSAGAPNPIVSNSFYVRQQYLDFLSREPDQAGYDSWLSLLNGCTNNAPSCDRIEVSASFFRSEEFQGKGYFIYRFYTTSFGVRPTFAEFDRDVKLYSARTDAEVEPKKLAFIADFINRAAWKTKYDALANAVYVDLLIQTAGVQAQVSLATRNQLVADLDGGGRTRGQVLRAVAESAEVNVREYNGAFVVMQYFGYLRRDPEDAGYQAWLAVINANPTNYRQMVDGFANSTEYRKRFGQP